MKLISWNVNGLRACYDKGFVDVFHRLEADFFCLQETKKRPIFVNETGRLSLLIKENVFSIITVPNHWEQEFLLQRHLFAEQRNLKVHSAD